MITSTRNEPKQKHGKLPQITPAQLRPARRGWKAAKAINKAGDPVLQKSGGFGQRLKQWGRCQQRAPMHRPEKGAEDPAGSSVDALVGPRL